MKQLAQYQDGRLELQDVPPPAIPPGGILVRTLCSVISPGTEKMKVEQARMNLLQKAKARPDQVRKVLATAKTLGWKAALEKVRNRLESPTPLGYSAAGIVEKVDPLNTRFRVGDLVACGGAECAHHAEFIAIPDLLASPVPDGVEPWQAAYTTLASISLQAVRQAGVRLGDRVLVVGQGLVGQLATALLRASGARVMASDLSPSRLETATRMGAERIFSSNDGNLPDAAREWTDGHGVDTVLLCIGGDSPQVTRDAIASLRDRGTLVIVGIFDARLEWKEACMKDIQVRYSRSYGPGRYDPSYEFGGSDYPVGHVRWTENRNFEACLHLMRSGSLDLTPVTTRRAGFSDALQVYQDLMQPGNADIGVVLEYASPSSSTGMLPVSSSTGMLPASSSTGMLPASSNSDLQPESRSAGMLPAPGRTTAPLPADRSFHPYDPNRKTDKTRRNLPHWEQEGVTQFVTFRQADAIPQSKIAQWREERDRWLALHPRPWDEETEDTFHHLFQERQERWLDQGGGSCILARPEAAQILEQAFRHFDGERYILDDFVIMPNHVHVLVKPLPGHDLSAILHSWKGHTSREIKRRLKLDYDRLWQEERFDHALRSESSLRAKRDYIRANPSKAKLGSGFVLGCGLGIVSNSDPQVKPSGTGMLPEPSSTGFQPESCSTGMLPEPSSTGMLPEPSSPGFQPEPSSPGFQPEPSSTGMLPVSSRHRLQPESAATRIDSGTSTDAGKMPAALATGFKPVLRLHVVGAGNFARTMLLPHLRGTLPLGTIVNATGLSARHVKQKFGFDNDSTDPAAAFGDAGAAVLIATRHHLHAPMVMRGLQSHQHVFVEKPLCLTREELDQIDAAVQESKGSVMVGFNRRFAPATLALRERLKGVPGPKSLAFHVNAGPLAPDHWYANLEESGGRILGEACHFIDFACAVLATTPVRVTAQTTIPPRGAKAFPDSMAAQVEFADGSCFQLIYTGEGDPSFPKEHFRLFAAGLVAEGENFQTLRIHHRNRTQSSRFSSKGHAEEMQAWIQFLKGAAPHPLPYPEARTSTLVTLALLESIRQRRPVDLV